MELLCRPSRRMISWCNAYWIHSNIFMFIFRVCMCMYHLFICIFVSWRSFEFDSLSTSTTNSGGQGELRPCWAMAGAGTATSWAARWRWPVQGRPKNSRFFPKNGAFSSEKCGKIVDGEIAEWQEWRPGDRIWDIMGCLDIYATKKGYLGVIEHIGYKHPIHGTN